MTRWPSRLEGGPFDGDQGSWENLEAPPNVLWAWSCADPMCRFGGIHWSTEPVKRGEPYHFTRMDGPVHVYVHADVDLDGLPTVSERELVPA